jgi:hypothetical protein
MQRGLSALSVAICLTPVTFLLAAESFEAAKQMDTKESYERFLATYSSKDSDRKLAQQRLDSLNDGVALPDALKADAAAAFAGGAKYFLWRDASDAVELIGESNAVIWILFRAHAIAAPGSDGALFVPVTTTVLRTGGSKKAPLEGLGKWNGPANDSPGTAGVAYATAGHPARVLAVYNAEWGGADRRLKGKGTFHLGLADHVTWSKTAAELALISNVVSVEVDCAEAGKKRKDSTPSPAAAKRRRESPKAVVVLPAKSDTKDKLAIHAPLQNAVIQSLKDEGLFPEVLTPEEAQGRNSAELLEIRASVDVRGDMAGRKETVTFYGFRFRITDPLTGDELWDDEFPLTVTSSKTPQPGPATGLATRVAKTGAQKIREARTKYYIF